MTIQICLFQSILKITISQDSQNIICEHLNNVHLSTKGPKSQVAQYKNHFNRLSICGSKHGISFLISDKWMCAMNYDVHNFFSEMGVSFWTLLNKKVYFLLKTYNKQECIPEGCVPSAAVAVSPTMHVPPPCPPTTHTCCHTYPPLCMPLCHAHPPPPPHTMHAPHHTCLHLPCMPTAMHTPLPHMPPPTMHATPPVDKILDTCLWKHYLSATTVADGNKQECPPALCHDINDIINDNLVSEQSHFKNSYAKNL